LGLKVSLDYKSRFWFLKINLKPLPIAGLSKRSVKKKL
jgi:hypothetical protein